MKILFTADLHMNIPARSPRTGRTSFDVFAEAIRTHQPDAVVMAGDIGSLYHGGEHLRAIQEVSAGAKVAVTLGNHDFWLERDGHGEFPNLVEIVDCFWRVPARESGVTLLDVENLDLGEIALVGGYGHFDLGLAEPNLKIAGTPITEEIYLSGGLNRLFWNDFQYIPNCGNRLRAEAMEQADGIAVRMDAAIAIGQRLLVAVHTCPWRELNGHPLRGCEQDILSAYSGNSRVGMVMEQRAEHIDLLVCGHTHMPVRENNLLGIQSLNIGTDYGVFRGIIYNTLTRTIRWIGEPF